MTHRSLLVRASLGVLAVLVFLVTAIPLLWMVMSSIKPTDAITSPTPQILFTPTTEHYQRLFSGGNNLTPYIENSLVASLSASLIATALGAAAGYGLSRVYAKRKSDLAFWIISTRMAPIAAVLVPLYLIFRALGLLDSVMGLVVAYLTFTLPFAVWIMNAFFAALPPTLEEAAHVDGASRWSAFWRIALPLTAPGLVTTWILCLVFSWNDYAFAQTFSGTNGQTIPIAATQLITQTGIDWGQLTAIGTIVVLPMILAGLAVRRWLVTGLTLGAVTGE